MLNKVYAKNHINNSIAESLYRYGHYYDSLETDIYVDTKIKKDNELLLMLNNKMFSFINQIHIEFENDFDNKINFKRLPCELNRLINSYLIDEKSIKFDLYKINELYEIDYKIYNINKNLNSCKIKFKLNKEYLDKIKEHDNIKNLINEIPNYLIKNDDYGITINSTVNRNLRFIITYMNYNNAEFYEYNEKYLEKILS